MSLADRVHIARRFQLSIRIDSDLRDPKALDGFVCPKSSANVLLTMANHVSETGQAAFTWTGPYGTGKSSLALVLSALLNGDIRLREQAAAILGKSVVSPLRKAFPLGNRGWRILPVVGRRSDPAQVIGEAAVACGLVPKGQVKRWTDSNLLSTLNKLSTAKPKMHGGLVVFVDEMGKFLEGAAHDNRDIYFFQQLAEAAVRSKGRLLVVGILHQAFGEYAQRLARDVRDEWAKVQGRFLDLALNTAGDEQLELISRAIQSDQTTSSPSPVVRATADTIGTCRPSASPHIKEYLEGCWPLHPVVACLLGPISRRRFGQNQRSLFGFLNSAEPYGFQDFIKNSDDDAIYSPDRLWDYLRANLEPAILASPDGHRWSMAVEVVERCEALGGSQTHIQLLKTIALLDLFRERSGLSATPKLLHACIEGVNRKSTISDALKELETWSFVLFRKHLGAYAIYAGSDFDIEQALTESLEATREIDFAQLREFAGLQPLLAKRHYHETGSLRWFYVDLVPLSSLNEFVPTSGQCDSVMGNMLLVVPTHNESRSTATKICKEAVQRNGNKLIVGFSPASWQVMQLAREFLALTRIFNERPELGGDSVARREVIARIADGRSRLEADLRGMFDNAEWHHDEQKPRHYTSWQLNALASNIADARFSKTPRLSNELLNRDRPSSNAIAAQKALLKLMVLREGEARLGIEGYPAEGGLFDSILLEARLYRKNSDVWAFGAPEKNDDPCNLLPAWKAGAEFLHKNTQRSVPLGELYALWKASPFGIKAGLLPVIAVSFLISHRNKLAFYREGIFQHRFTDLDIDYLTMSPDTIQVRWMDLSLQAKEILTGLASIVRELDKENRLIDLAPIDVARGLVAVYEGLTPWVKRTSRLSLNALKVRNTLKQASDPNKLLFDDLPALMHELRSSESVLSPQAVVSIVKDGMHELSQVHSGMLTRLQTMMLTELQVPNTSSQALAELRARAENVHHLTGDFRLNAFISRLVSFTGFDADVEGIASLAANKPPRDWVDADLDQAAVEIANLSQKFVHSEAFARVKGRPDKRQAMAVVVGMHGRPTPVVGEFSVRDTDRKAINGLIEKVEEALASSDRQSRSIILAALAEMSARYLLPEKDEHSGISPKTRNCKL